MNYYHLNNHIERELSNPEEIKSIFRHGKYATIAMCRSNEPYVVTLSYGYDAARQCLYFHAANKGLKLDFLKSNPDVCGTIIEDGGYIHGECGHNYKSLVFRGEMKVVEDMNEMKHGMEVLLRHLEKDPNVITEKLMKSESFYTAKMVMLRLDLKHVSGKAGR